MADPLGRGRPHKGARIQRTTRVRPSIDAQLRKEAAEQDLSMSDVIANLLAEHCGEAPMATPRPANESIQELPLTG